MGGGHIIISAFDLVVALYHRCLVQYTAKDNTFGYYCGFMIAQVSSMNED